MNKSSLVKQSSTYARITASNAQNKQVLDVNCANFLVLAHNLLKISFGPTHLSIIWCEALSVEGQNAKFEVSRSGCDTEVVFDIFDLVSSF